MWQGYEWATFARFWTETLEMLVRKHANNDGTRSARLLSTVATPVIAGTGIVMSVSFLERVILDALKKNNSTITWVKLTNDDWAKELGINLEWSGWPLIEILTRLRHCFAHEYGRATQKQIEALLNLKHSIEKKPIKIKWSEKEHSICPFYKIDLETEEIILETSDTCNCERKLSPSQSIRIILLSFLEELDKVGVVDLDGWKKASEK